MIRLHWYDEHDRAKFGVERFILACGCREVQVHFGLGSLRFCRHDCKGRDI